jgi:hypothetical protein
MSVIADIDARLKLDDSGRLRSLAGQAEASSKDHETRGCPFSLAGVKASHLIPRAQLQRVLDLNAAMHQPILKLIKNPQLTSLSP